MPEAYFFNHEIHQVAYNSLLPVPSSTQWNLDAVHWFHHPTILSIQLLLTDHHPLKDEQATVRGEGSAGSWAPRWHPTSLHSVMLWEPVRGSWDGKGTDKRQRPPGWHRILTSPVGHAVHWSCLGEHAETNKGRTEKAEGSKYNPPSLTSSALKKTRSKIEIQLLPPSPSPFFANHPS
jgi:hypothetical protein